METVFQQLVDRTRSRLHVPHLRTLFGRRYRPRVTTAQPEPAVVVAIETSAFDRTLFRLQFGLQTLKAYTKGERVLRFEAVVHNTKTLDCGRRLERFPMIVARLRGMLERFVSMLDCVITAFVADRALDELPQPAWVGRTRVGGLDLNKPRTRASMQAVMALAAAPDGFRVTDFAEQIRSLTRQSPSSYTIRQAAYDLKRLRAKHLVTKHDSKRRYAPSLEAVREITALLVLPDHVIRPLLAGVRTPWWGRRPSTWTRLDDHYQPLRLDMRALFKDLGLAA